MLPNDYRGKAVLVTGGTKGIGLAIGLAFGGRGADVYLTHRWSSANLEDLRALFHSRGAASPVVIEADASQDEDTAMLMDEIARNHQGLEVFVSNVSFAQVNKKGLGGYKKRHFFRALDYGSWPLLGYLQASKKRFGAYPRYSLASSCDGPDTYYPGYDYVALSKVVMETFCRYVAKHLWEEERAKINIIRSRPIATESLIATFGRDFEPFLRRYYGDDYLIEAAAFGEAAVALCSGLMDAVTGQVLVLDNGVRFQDNLMRIFEERAEHILDGWQCRPEERSRNGRTDS